VWLDGKRKVKAITSSEYMSAINIQKIIKGEVIDWVVKKDMDEHEFSVPMLQMQEQPKFNTPLFYTVLSGSRKGTSQILKTSGDSVANYKKYTIINKSILDLFRLSYPIEHVIFDNRVVLEVKKQEKITYKKEYGFKDKWEIENTFCYEAMLPLTKTQRNFSEYLRSDVEKFLGYKVFKEERAIPCLVLQKSETGINDTILNSFYNNAEQKFEKLDDLIWGLNYYQSVPIINETGINSKFNIGICDDTIYDEEDTKRILSIFGFKLVPAIRIIEVLVIKEVK